MSSARWKSPVVRGGRGGALGRGRSSTSGVLLDPERREPVVGAERAQPDRRLVEAAHAVDVAHPQPDRAEAGFAPEAHSSSCGSSSSAQRVDAEALAGRLRPVVEHVPEVAAACRADDLLRAMPWLMSSRISTASSSAGSTKLGQPEPESYFASDRKSSVPQPGAAVDARLLRVPVRHP